MLRLQCNAIVSVSMIAMHDCSQNGLQSVLANCCQHCVSGQYFSSSPVAGNTLAVNRRCRLQLSDVLPEILFR